MGKNGIAANTSVMIALKRMRFQVVVPQPTKKAATLVTA